MEVREWSRPAVALAAVTVAGWPCAAYGQSDTRVELYFGPGYFSSPSGRQPSRPTVEVGGTFWFGPRWGIGATFGFGIDDDLPTPVESGNDDGFLGRGELRFRQFRVERRIALSSDWDMILGFGVLGGEHTDVFRHAHLEPPEESEIPLSYGYVDFQIGARWRFHDRLSLRSGVSISAPLVIRASSLVSFELG